MGYLEKYPTLFSLLKILLGKIQPRLRCEADVEVGQEVFGLGVTLDRFHLNGIGARTVIEVTVVKRFGDARRVCLPSRQRFWFVAYGLSKSPGHHLVLNRNITPKPDFQHSAFWKIGK